MGFLPFIEIKALNIVVDVGFVTGVTPAITPMGSATVITPSSSFSSITPTVFLYFISL